MPWLCGGRDVRPARIVIEHERQQLDPGRPVDGRVVDGRQDGEALVGETLDHVGQPQRPRAIERPRDDARDDLGELVVAPGRRDGRVAHVEVQIEVGVLDPVGMVEPERDLDQAPAQRLEEVQALLELRAPRRVGVIAGRVRPRVDRQPRDVSELRTRLEMQERRVQSRELLHGPPSGFASRASIVAVAPLDCPAHVRRTRSEHRRSKGSRSASRRARPW